MSTNFCPDCGTVLAGPRKFCTNCRVSFSNDKKIGRQIPIVANTERDSSQSGDGGSNNALPLFLVGLGLFFFSILLITPIFFAGILIMVFISLTFAGVMMYYQFYKGGSW